jgi:hypothetical protein
VAVFDRLQYPVMIVRILTKFDLDANDPPQLVEENYVGTIACHEGKLDLVRSDPILSKNLGMRSHIFL